MSIKAEVIQPISPPHEQDSGLTIQFTVSGQDEDRFRAMMNVINDYQESFGPGGHKAGITKAMQHVFHIAFDAVELIEQHKNRLY